MATYNGHNEDSSGNILLSIGNGMTATVETGTTASQAYTKGALLFFNNRLCKATKAISSGATLAVGTNLSQTSLGAELTSHLRSSDGKEFYFDVKDGTYGYYPSASKVSSEFVPFGGTEVDLVISPQEKSVGTTTINVSGHKKYILWLRGSNVSIINATTVTSSSATIKQLFKSTTVLSSINAYAIYEVETSTTNTISLNINGSTVEQMVIGL